MTSPSSTPQRLPETVGFDGILRAADNTAWFPFLGLWDLKYMTSVLRHREAAEIAKEAAASPPAPALPPSLPPIGGDCLPKLSPPLRNTLQRLLRGPASPQHLRAEMLLAGHPCRTGSPGRHHGPRPRRRCLRLISHNWLGVNRRHFSHWGRGG